MFHDKMKRERLNSIGFPMLKGHVKIRLHNPNTWKTEIIEGDNMITDAVSDIFAANLCGSMTYPSMLPLYSKMFGGVLCFADTLNDSGADADKDYFIPHSGANALIAHAGQTTFSDQGDDIKRGNPLNTSMVVSDGAVTLAWEWGSSAGNGTIKSVGLTHSDVGDAGTGSNSNAFKAMTPNINGEALSAASDIWFIDSNGYGYNITYSGTSLTLTRIPMAYKKAGLVSQMFTALAGIPDSKTITIGTSYSGFPSFYFDKATSKLHLWYNTSLSTSVKYDVVNLSNWNSLSTSHEDWSLQTAVGGLTGRGPIAVPVYNGYVYLPKMNGNDITGYLKVNISSTGDETSISASHTNSGVFVPNKANKILVGKDFVINNDEFFYTSLEAPDVLNRTNNWNQWVHSTLDSGVGLTQMTYKKDGGESYYYSSVSKFYLATKYNLPAPVTKSNNQSMVITYTLTEV